MKKIGSCALLCALLLSLLSGCAAETFTEEHYTADPAQISQIQLDLRDRQVEVIASTDGQIHLRYSQSDSEFYRIAEKDGVLTMTSESNRKWYQYFGWKTNETHRIVVLELPPEALGSLAISTTNEDIRVSTLSVSDGISLSANGGNITFDGLRAEGAISLTVKNGDIQGTILGSYEEYSIECAIKKGESNLASNPNDTGKPLTISANNGDVAIQFQPSTQPQ